MRTAFWGGLEGLSLEIREIWGGPFAWRELSLGAALSGSDGG